MWLRADDSRVDFAIRVVGGMGPNGRVTVQLTCIYTGRSISIYICYTMYIPVNHFEGPYIRAPFVLCTKGLTEVLQVPKSGNGSVRILEFNK